MDLEYSIETGFAMFRRKMLDLGYDDDQIQGMRIAFAAGAAWALLVIERAAKNDGANQPIN